MATLIPPRGHVCVRVDDETVSPGGIILPDSAKEKRPSAGTIESIGLAEYNKATGTYVECDYAVGDVVALRKWAGYEVDTRGVKTFVCHFDDIIGKFVEE